PSRLQCAFADCAVLWLAGDLPGAGEATGIACSEATPSLAELVRGVDLVPGHSRTAVICSKEAGLIRTVCARASTDLGSARLSSGRAASLVCMDLPVLYLVGHSDPGHIFRWHT